MLVDQGVVCVCIYILKNASMLTLCVYICEYVLWMDVCACR